MGKRFQAKGGPFRTGALWVLAAVGALALCALVPELGSFLAPLPPALLGLPSPAREIVDRHGTPLRVLPSQQGSAGAMTQLPAALKNALLAAEDHRFFSHHGIDWSRVLKAGWDNARSGRIVSGASTITQQLIKISRPRRPGGGRRGLWDKVYEICAARRLERMWSKERILLEYANRLELGYLSTGVDEASEFYFGKRPESLSVAESALLAGMAQAPARLNPLRYPEASKRRRQVVLERMRRHGWLTAEEFARCSEEPLVMTSAGRPFLAPHFVDLLLEKGLPDGAPRIVSSLDLEVQRVAEAAVRAHLPRLASKNVTQASVVVIDNATGEVLALVGSVDYRGRRSGQVNGAWAPRSPGSALKPFTYLLALEAGMGPETVLADVPTVFETPTGTYEPENFNRQCRGPVLMRSALACSLNIPAVSLLHSLGGPFVLQKRLQYYGVGTLQKVAGHYGLGLTIGNAEVRLLELTNAYAALGRLGTPGTYSLLSGGSGHPMGNSPHAWLLTDMLADNSARSPAFGLRSALRFDFPVACKTGTSTSFRDNWAMAYTPEFSVGVWAGNFDGSPMRNVSGVSGAGPILHEVMDFLHQKRGTSWYPTPEHFRRVPIHPHLGRRTNTAECVEEWFPEGALPSEVVAADFDGSGRPVLDARYAQWAGEGGEAAPRFSVRRPERLVIRHPRPNTRFILDPEIPGSQWIPLRCEGPNPVKWEGGGLKIVTRGDATFAMGVEGFHEVIARDLVTGDTQSVPVEFIQK